MQNPSIAYRISKFCQLSSISLSLLYYTCLISSAQSIQDFNQIKWSTIIDLPNLNTVTPNPGLAGAFMGVHNDALIIAGGANFPNGPAWEGGSKVYHDKVYLLQKESDGFAQWLEMDLPNLNNEVAYGLSIPTDEGLICLGGNNNLTTFTDAFILKWNRQSSELTTEPFPSLPIPATDFTGAVINNSLYIAGNSLTNDKFFYRIGLNNLDDSWESLPTWDGATRTHAIGITQNNGAEEVFYLMKGRIKTAPFVHQIHTDSHVYSPTTNSWEVLKTKHDYPITAGTAIAYGANHILLFGGADGVILNQLESLEKEFQAESDPLLKTKLKTQKNAILNNHPGFTSSVWAYHTVTDSWTKLNDLPSSSQVTTTALQWDDDIIIPTGEISPCIRTPNILKGEIIAPSKFGTLNYIVLIFYLGLMVLLGLYLSKNQHTTEDFFKGGQRIPWWAAGLSIYATQLSAITFMAIPAKTFATDWLYFFLNATIIMVAPFIIRYFLPFYRRFNLTTAYEYLEKRFNLAARLIGSTMYIFLQLGRLGIVLLLPSLALSVVTGIDVQLCILSMGILSIIYTVLGGIEAVIWTDVLQVIVLLGGALLAAIILFFNIDTELLTLAINDYDKLKIFDTRFDFSSPTLWVVLLGGFATNFIQYGSDQTVIQRYLTTKDEDNAAKSIWIGAWLTVPSTIIFFGLGTLLFVFYKDHPEALSISMDKTDAIFPWYIINNLPDGISGILIAAIFAASMSSLDSSMNSVSTVITTDFIKRLRPLKSEQNYLKTARIITAIIGLLGTALALTMATWGISSLWDQFNIFVGLFTGGLGGIFILGIFTKKANGIGAVTGLVVSGLVQFWIRSFTDIHLLLYAFTGIIVSFGVGYIVSLVSGSSEGDKSDWSYFGLG